MIRSIAACAALLLCTAAAAGDWKAAADRSLTFTGAYMGEPFQGRFWRFETSIHLDPANPGDAYIEARIDVASASTSNEEYDATLHGGDFFDSREHPEALFVARNVRRTGEDRYEADGELTLRGRTVAVPFPFQFRIEDDRARLTAKVTLRRLDFGIGAGDWADTDLIANEVEVGVDVPLTR